MQEVKLKFNEELYSREEIKAMISDFQKNGYVVLPKVFERESVKKFKKELEGIMVFNGLAYTIPDDTPHYMAAALAPRGRQILPGALSHSVAKPMPSLHTSIFVIETDENRGYAPDWHKDRQPDGMPGNEYHYPSDVFLAFYFEDIDKDHGPTQIIPGSHRDVSLMPSNSEAESIYLNMEDALLIDQRAWHRGVSRKTDGTRFVFVYGFYGVPHHYGFNFKMPRIQLHHWMNSSKLEDRVLFGGTFAPPTKETLDIYKEEIENSTVLNQISFPKMS